MFLLSVSSLSQIDSDISGNWFLNSICGNPKTQLSFHMLGTRLGDAHPTLFVSPSCLGQDWETHIRLFFLSTKYIFLHYRENSSTGKLMHLIYYSLKTLLTHCVSPGTSSTPSGRHSAACNNLNTTVSMEISYHCAHCSVSKSMWSRPWSRCGTPIVFFNLKYSPHLQHSLRISSDLCNEMYSCCCVALSESNEIVCDLPLSSTKDCIPLQKILCIAIL